jgi:glycosyltransferase involved in cell wall biosynthesis
VKTPPYRGNGVRRLMNILTFVARLWRRSARLAAQCRPDVVIASSTYPLDIVPAHAIARKSGAKLVYEVHDLWPLTPVELGRMSRRHPFILLMQWAENFAYLNAHRVVSMLPNAKQHMCAHGMHPAKFAYVPNGVEISEWVGEPPALPQPHREALDRIRRERRFLLGYVGGHALSNALHTLLEAAPALESRGVSTVLVGQGAEKDALERRAKDFGLEHTVFLPPLPKRSVPALLAEMDACYLGFARSPLYRFGICPNKLFDYMMAAKPVIQAVEAANDLVAEAGCGVTVPPEDPAAIVDAVERIRSLSPPEREVMGRRGKSYVTAHHDYRLLARRFLEAILDERTIPGTPISAH